MTQEHPITPPPELVQEWWEATMPGISTSVKDQLCIQAAQWGADQELEACCRWIEDQLCMPPDARADVITQLNGSRRPKPPSLKEQALADLDSMSIEPCLINGIDTNALVRAKYDNIRHALEALPND